MIKTSTTFISLKDESTKMMNGWEDIPTEEQCQTVVVCQAAARLSHHVKCELFSLFFMSHYINEQAAGVESCDGLSRAAFAITHYYHCSLSSPSHACCCRSLDQRLFPFLSFFYICDNVDREMNVSRAAIITDDNNALFYGAYLMCTAAVISAEFIFTAFNLKA